MSESLWDIIDGVEEFNKELAKSGGEITPELAAIEESIKLALTTKTDACCDYVNRLDHMIGVAERRIEEFKRFINARTNEKEAFKNYVKNCLLKSDQKEFTGQISQIKLTNPSKKLQVHSENKIPMEYKKFIPSSTAIDKKLLTEAIKTGKYKGDAATIIDGEHGIKFSLITKKNKSKKKKIGDS